MSGVEVFRHGGSREASTIEEHIAQEDSPVPGERAEQEPGDWTKHGEN